MSNMIYRICTINLIKTFKGLKAGKRDHDAGHVNQKMMKQKGVTKNENC